MSCYLSFNCKKFNENQCTDSHFCIRRFKEDQIFDLGLFSSSQRVHIPLFIVETDPDSELKAFARLNDIERSILDLVTSGRNIYLYSSTCGNGKTAWSLRLAQSYIDKIWHNTEIGCRVLYINVPKFLLELKSNITQRSTYIAHIHKYVLDADLVIWDDIGSKGGTEFEIENMLSLINNRLDNNKSNIYTSNISPDKLSQVLGPRLSSRLLGMSELINLQGQDKRGLSS